MMLARDTGAIDIDGDGVIDEYEIALAKYLRSARGAGATKRGRRNLRLGSGSARAEFNELAAMRERGKRLMVDQIREKYRGRMSLLAPGLRGKDDDACAALLVRSTHFGRSLNGVRRRGKIIDMKASRQVEEALCGGTRGSPGRSERDRRWSDDFFGRPGRRREELRRTLVDASRLRKAERERRTEPYARFMREHCGYFRMSQAPGR
jgi:hypothetical protein